MRKKIIALAVAVLAGLTPLTAFAEPAQAPEVLGEAAVLMDAATGEVLYEKNSHEHLYPASITKLMTTLLAVENAEMDEVLTFSHDAVFSIEPGSSHIAIDEGEQITMEQALYAIYLQSANEVSNGVAEHIGGTMADFAALMNARAQALGCTDTNFVNANGLHDDNHYTSAYDMALIAREVQKHDSLMKIMGTTYYELPPTNLQPETRYLYAQTQMIKESSLYYYEPCLGGKNGFTNQSLNTLVTFAEKDGTRLICVVLKEPGAQAYVDSINLFDYGFANYQTVNAFAAGGFSAGVPLKQTYREETIDAGEAQIVAETDIVATLPLDTDLSALRQETHYPETIAVPAAKGDVVGSVDVYLGDTLLGSSNLLLAADAPGIPEAELDAQAKAAKTALVLKIVKVVLVVLLACLLLFGLVYLYAWYCQYQRKKRWQEAYCRKYREKYGRDPARIPTPRKRPRATNTKSRI